jgi:hypothetical protein
MNISEILAACIEEIESGRSTVEQCLERYESVHAELEPLLKMALNIQPAIPVKPDKAFKINARVRLMEHIHNERESRKSFLRMPLRNAWVRVSAIVLAIVLVLGASGTGTAYASQDSLPGEMLYPVKTLTEDFRIWLETDKAAEAALVLEFADRRLTEMEKLTVQAPEYLSIASSGYEKNLSTAFEKIGQIQEENRYHETLEQCSVKMIGFVAAFDVIEDAIDETGTYIIGQSREMTMNRYSLTIRSMSEIDGVRATEMNIQMMQNRLQRAHDSTLNGWKFRAEEALGQYVALSQLSEDIIQIAEDSGQDTAEMVRLNFEAAQRYRHQLGQIDNTVSGEIKSEADSATETMMQHQQQGPPDTPGNTDNGFTGQDSPQQTSGPAESPVGSQGEADSQQPDGQGQEHNGSQGGAGGGSGK